MSNCEQAVCTTLTVCYSQDQSSEEFIGEWAEQRGVRDQLVIATKVTIIRFLELRPTDLSAGIP